METLVIDRKILPEPIFSYIQSEKIKVSRENGSVVLSPVKIEPNVDELFGMFSDGKLSSAEFIKQKAIEKDMES
ncbi:MAG: hypothetical protein LBQ94_10255 [Treponema sp.]|jgi:hypothetical protein|nr:hypothetical protein [Treponema sp.]